MTTARKSFSICALTICAAFTGTAATAGAGPDSWVGDLSSIGASDWNYDRAAYLLERAGFGGTPEEIQALANMTPQEAVRRLVRYQEVKDVDLPPFIETGIYPSPTFYRGNDPATGTNAITFALISRGRLDQLPPERRAFLMNPVRTGVTPEMQRLAKTDKQAVIDAFYYYGYIDGLEMRRAETWLADRMLKTRRPLQEKLVLFGTATSPPETTRSSTTAKCSASLPCSATTPTATSAIFWSVSVRTPRCSSISTIRRT